MIISICRRVLMKKHTFFPLNSQLEGFDLLADGRNFGGLHDAFFFDISPSPR